MIFYAPRAFFHLKKNPRLTKKLLLRHDYFSSSSPKYIQFFDLQLLEDTVQERLSRGGDTSKPVEDMTLEELEEMEDEADEQILLEYR